MQYLANLEDDYWLPKIRQSDHIHILTGSGNFETPDASRAFSILLHSKNIPHELDVWGPDMATRLANLASHATLLFGN